MRYIQYEDDYGNLIVEYEDDDGFLVERKQYEPYRDEGETKYRETQRD